VQCEVPLTGKVNSTLKAEGPEANSSSNCRNDDVFVHQ